MHNRTAVTIWKGTGKQGTGYITTHSRVLENIPYSYSTRFENEPGTNPEELIAAAHAACFSMKLSFVIGEAGFTPEVIETTGKVRLEKSGIISSHLDVKAKVPGISADKFEECAQFAKENCPVSKALNLEITMSATLSENALVN